MNLLIARYTHTAHIIVDGLLGVVLALYALAAALGALYTNGQPAHILAAIVAFLLIASQRLRSANAKLEELDPGSPLAPPQAGVTVVKPEGVFVLPPQPADPPSMPGGTPPQTAGPPSIPGGG